jgi:hypothetical protein
LYFLLGTPPPGLGSQRLEDSQLAVIERIVHPSGGTGNLENRMRWSDYCFVNTTSPAILTMPMVPIGIDMSMPMLCSSFPLTQ